MSPIRNNMIDNVCQNFCEIISPVFLLEALHIGVTMCSWKKGAQGVSREMYVHKSRYNSSARRFHGEDCRERRGSSVRETFRNKRARTSTARKPVDVSDVWGGVQNRFKNAAAADRTSNPFYRLMSETALHSSPIFIFSPRFGDRNCRNIDGSRGESAPRMWTSDTNKALTAVQSK